MIPAKSWGIADDIIDRVIRESRYGTAVVWNKTILMAVRKIQLFISIID